MGRFINADSVTSTGCGLLGMNMFAYCNNSPVVYSDDSGCAPWPTTKVMSDGYSLPNSASTDGNEGSNELLEYLINNDQIPKSDSIVNITVQKVENHIETDDAWLNLIVAHVEMFAGKAATAILPFRPDIAAAIDGVGKVLGTIGYLQLWYDVVSKPLSPGDYDQYTVVMSWSHTEQINGIYCTTYYTETSYYLSWESNPYDNSPWYLRSYVRDFDMEYYP